MGTTTADKGRGRYIQLNLRSDSWKLEYLLAQQVSEQTAEKDIKNRIAHAILIFLNSNN